VLEQLSQQHREELESTAPMLLEALHSVLGPRREARAGC
jgi:hypothetical protein